MSYEGRHWACGRDRNEPHDDCKQCHSTYDPEVDDCQICGRDAMICPCGPEEKAQWSKFEQAMEIYPDSIEHHEKAATERRNPR